MSGTTGGGAGQAPASQSGQTGGEGQAPPAGQGQEGQAPEGQQGNQDQGTESQGGSGDQFDLSTITDPAVRAHLEGIQRSAEEARAQAARYRTERNTYRDQFTTLQQQHETAEQRATREQQERDQAAATERERLSTLEDENRRLRAGAAIQAAATGAHNPDVVARMIAGQVTYDDQGQPTNVQDLVANLRQSDPYLFRRTSADAGTGGGEGSAPPATMNDLIRGQVAARKGRTVETN